MKIMLNYQAIEASSGSSLETLLHQAGFGHLRGIAVAHNGVVIPRGEWTHCTLAEGDELLVIRPSQGG